MKIQTKRIIALIGIVVGILVLRLVFVMTVIPEAGVDYVAEYNLLSAPIDPFSGQMLIYNTNEDSFSQYSIGRDFKDDGGKLREDRVFLAGQKAVKKSWPAGEG